MKIKQIEKITYKSSNQALSYREIFKLQDKKIKLLIKSDAIQNQCYAKACVLKNDEWVEIYNILYSLMKTPDSLAYKYSREPEKAMNKFLQDRDKLVERVGEVLL